MFAGTDSYEFLSCRRVSFIHSARFPDPKSGSHHANSEHGKADKIRLCPKKITF